MMQIPRGQKTHEIWKATYSENKPDFLVLKEYNLKRPGKEFPVTKFNRYEKNAH